MVHSNTGERSFFPRFRWPLPESFGAAIAASRFELGDVLYRDAAAYGAWRDEIPTNATAIQVLDPPRSARGNVVDGDSSRRVANWSSEVRIALVDPVTGQSEERVLTQGKLLMALWQGDESWLDAERSDPDFPSTARDLHGRLEEIRNAWQSDIKSSRPRSGSLFAMVVDLASDASRAKASLVAERLGSSGKLRVVDKGPCDVGLPDGERFHPTLILRAFIVPGRDIESVEAELRACLYRGGASRGGLDSTLRVAAERDSAPSANADSEAAETESGDRFSVARHGLFFGY